MEKDCLYCGTHFTAQRASKKYCSDNCKQMAYFKRNGLVLSGGSDTSDLKYETPVIVKTENLKDSVHAIVKGEMKFSEKEIVKSDAIAIDDKIRDSIISRLTIVMTGKLNQAIEKIKNELNVKYENPIVKPDFTESIAAKDNTQLFCNYISFNGVLNSTTENKYHKNYCYPSEELIVKRASVPENAITANPENQEADFTLTEIKDTSFKNSESENKETQEEQTAEIPHQMEVLELADDEDELDEEQEAENIIPNIGLSQIQESEQKINKQDTELENKSSSAVEQEETQEYKRLESKFIKSIEKNYLNNNEHLFNEPLRYWNGSHAVNVNWISVRLRCLLESIIKLSNYNKIDKHTLLCITDAFNRLIKSNAFKNLPDKYPYSGLIKELCIKLNRLVQKSEYSEQIKFSLSTEIKSRLISIRYEMLNYFPASKFSELDFIEEKNLLGKNEKNENEKENEKKTAIKNNWRIRHEAMKRQQLRGAA